MNNGNANPAQYPQNTLELLKYIGKKIPERLLKALPWTIAFGVFGWVFHTFLLVYINEGFGESTWLGKNILHTRGNLFSATTLWTLFGAIVPLLFNFFRSGGNPFKRIAAIFKMPSDILNKNKASGGKFLPVILITIGVTLLSDRIFSGVTAALAGGIIMSSVVAFLTGRGSIFIQILRMIFNDIQMFILKKRKMSLDNDSVLMVIGMSGTTLLLFGLYRSLEYFLPYQIRNVLNHGILANIFSYLWIVFIILGVVLLFSKRQVPKQFMFFICFFGTAYIFCRLNNIQVFADDGGWAEAGGNFGDWVKREGAVEAAFNGFLPAVGGLVGNYVANILGGLFTGLGPVPDSVVVPPPDVPPTGGDVPPAGPDGTQPAGQEPVKETPEQEAERLKQEAEAERLRQEFEANRLKEMEKQKEAKEKALKELERIQKEKAERQAYIDKLCKKYNCSPSELRDKIREAMGKSAAEAAAWDRYDKQLAIAEAGAKLTLIAADTAIDGLANITGPVGKQVRAGYKVIKGTAAGAAEAYSKDKSMWAGAASGLVKGAADAGSDYIDSNKIKAGLAIGSEVVGGAITDGRDGALDGLKNGVYNVGAGMVTDKLGGGGYGNDVNLVRMSGGKTAVIMTTGAGQTFTRIVTNGTADNFIKGKLINQAFQSGVKGTSATLQEFVIKPALQGAGILPK